MTTHQPSKDSFKSLTSLTQNNKTYYYHSLKEASKNGLGPIEALPYSLMVLLENLLRREDGDTIQAAHIQSVANWLKERRSSAEIAYYPARVLMQDFTGVPAIVDLAAMRDAMHALGGNPQAINPLARVDLIIDHSVQVDQYASPQAFEQNVAFEYERNRERYEFLRWGQNAFSNFKVVPPGTGICHQVNLEYLADVVSAHAFQAGEMLYPDTLVGTDSHTTMINGLGVLGWGVGGIEAEAVMLGQPYSMLIPEVVGVELSGELPEGVTATDLVLRITEMLREYGVVGKFVEFYGSGLAHLSLPDRATIANMAPEYGATCGFFPVDQETLRYLELSGRPAEVIQRTEAYAKAQGFWCDANSPSKVYSHELKLNLNETEPSLAGPKRPQDRVALNQIASTFAEFLGKQERAPVKHTESSFDGQRAQLQHGDIVIAAITSCTNTSNPSVMLAAGLVAKKAIEKGLSVKPWVKTSLAPGSKVVTDYYKATDLQQYFDQLGFNLVGYGCTTCIGNSGPLPDPIEKAIKADNVLVSAVLSGNRNFEGRIHPAVEANWLASPPLVVAFALAGTVNIDLKTDPLGQDAEGHPVYLRDIWPTQAEIAAQVQKITGSMFSKEYAAVFDGDDHWRALAAKESQTYSWTASSTYIQQPPYFEQMQAQPSGIAPIQNARILALLGDSITTDHISPAGAFKPSTPAGTFLVDQGVAPREFNSYGARRGNHQVMMRGTFANVRIRNAMADGKEGGYTRNLLTNEVQSIYDAAIAYQQANVPLVVIGGKEYGTGSSRDWAAKGTLLLGVKAVIAESFERIHRTNLIGMGVLPLQFIDVDRNSLGLTGEEVISIQGLNDELQPGIQLSAEIKHADGQTRTIPLQCRIDTQREVEYFRHGGILPFVLRDLYEKQA